MTKTSWILCILFASLLCILLSLHISTPWQFPNDDNGAWFSAIARSHQHAGLAGTRGQDFFTSRETDALVPYLHHPPLPGLLLAAAFQITGHDTPLIARLTFSLLHVITFVVVVLLAIRICPPRDTMLRFTYILAVAATVPMSTFYGKMPNHESPGLLFFILGVLAWGFPRVAEGRGRTCLALLAWLFAIFASWHAAICILAWLLMNWDRQHHKRMALSILTVLGMVGVVILHLFWAHRWEALPSQSESLKQWVFTVDTEALASNIYALRHAIGIGIGRFAYLPAILAMLWTGNTIIERIKTHTMLSNQERAVLGLGLGSVTYALLFPHAVSNHAYQGFYLIPFVALASSIMLDRLCQATKQSARFKTNMALVILLLTCSAGILLTCRMYRKHSTHAVSATESLKHQYR